MKTKSKALLLTLCAVLLVTASVLGTMAYLTSKDEVKNTFTVGSVAITMDETDVDNSTKDKDRDTENSYKLLPGQEYTKDPIIHVDTNSEDCFLFVKVENEIADIESKKAGKSVAAQMIDNGWAQVEVQTGIYVYVDKTTGATNPATVTKKMDVPVFGKLAIDGSVDSNKLAQYKDKTIKVTAYAVQKAGFENKTPADIWTTAFPNA